MPRRNRKAVKENEASPNGSAAGCRLQRVKVTPAADFHRNLSHAFLPFSIGFCRKECTFSQPAPLLRFVYATQRQYIRLKMPCQFLRQFLTQEKEADTLRLFFLCLIGYFVVIRMDPSFAVIMIFFSAPLCSLKSSPSRLLPLSRILPYFIVRS